MSASAMRHANFGGVRVLISPGAEQLCEALVERTRTAAASNGVSLGPSLPPVLDADGLLRFRGLWVAIPEAQLSLVTLLVQRFQSTVRDAELAAAYGTETDSRSLSGALNRLGRRVVSCDLALRRVRLRGYILDGGISVS